MKLPKWLFLRQTHFTLILCTENLLKGMYAQDIYNLRIKEERERVGTSEGDFNFHVVLLS